MFWSKKEEQNSLVLPSFFSVDAKSSKKRTTKKVFKIILKVIKIIVYLFFFGMGLYGCFQSWTDYWTVSSTVPGQGLELGFGIDNSMGAVDPAYVLMYSGSGAWYPFSGFTFAYGPFYALFVWPFAQLLLLFMYATRSWPVGLNAILGIFIILLIIRIITMLISSRSMLQSERMQEIQGKVAEINAKYKDAKDMASKQKKQLEIQDLYRKHNVKPFAMLEQIFVTLPIFLIIYRVISILRPLKFVTVFDAWDLTESPISQIFNNFTTSGWKYIFFIILVIPSQFLSQIVPKILAKKRSKGAPIVIQQGGNKKSKRGKLMQNIMSIFMAIIAVISASGIGLYWFFNSLFSIAQSAIIHKIIMARRAKGVTVESKLAKLGIE